MSETTDDPTMTDAELDAVAKDMADQAFALANRIGPLIHGQDNSVVLTALSLVTGSALAQDCDGDFASGMGEFVRWSKMTAENTSEACARMQEMRSGGTVQ